MSEFKGPVQIELRELVEPWADLPVVDQCRLLGLPRSSYYYHPAVETDENIKIMRRMPEQSLYCRKIRLDL